MQQRSAARADAEDVEEDDGKAQEDAELLEAINENKEENNGRIGDQYVTRFLREKLLSKPCQNQGYILDGYPKTLEQAKELFAGKQSREYYIYLDKGVRIPHCPPSHTSI